MKKYLFLMIIGFLAAAAAATPYYFHTASGKNTWVDVDSWLGTGSSETVLVIDWNFMSGPYTTESHAFGYRWDGSATTEKKMLQDFDDAGVFDLVTGYGGGFIMNIIYNDGNGDQHTHVDEEGSWNLASTDDPDKSWGDAYENSQWDLNNAGIDSEYIADGQFEGINAVLYFGYYPSGKSSIDYPLDIPTPEPMTVVLLGLGGMLVKRIKA